MGFIRKNKDYIFSILIPLIFLLLMAILNGTFIFGENTFSVYDSFCQYVPFAKYIANDINNLDIHTYTMTTGGGLDLLSSFAYYGASPFNIFYVIFDELNAFIIYDFLFILRIILASFTSTFTIKKLNQVNNAYLFGLMYAFSGYVTAYYWNSIWSDCIFIFPLLYYFLVRFLENTKNKKYAIYYMLSLGFALFSNFYIAYEMCLFVIIIFFMTDFKGIKDIIFKGLKLLGYSLTAVLCNIFLLTYAIIFLLGGNAGGNYANYNFNLWDYPQSFLFGYVSSSSTSYNYLYFSIAGLVLLVLFLLEKENSKKDKIKLTLYIILSIAFAIINPLNYIIHGFDYPNFLFNRYTFMFIFIFILYSSKMYKNLQNVKRKSLFFATIILFLFFMICGICILFKAKNYTDVDMFYVILSIILLVIVVYFIYKKHYKFLSILIIFELCTSFFYAFMSLGTNEYPNYGECTNVKDYVISSGELNYGLYNDANSADIFLSTINKDYSRFLNPLLLTSGNVFYDIGYANPLVSSMCGINQIYVPDEYLDEALKCQLLEFKFDNIFIFKYPLSVGYAIKDDLFGIDLFNNKSDVVTDNNRFCSAVTGIDNYCKSVDYHILYDDNNYYIVFDNNYSNVTFVINNSRSSSLKHFTLFDVHEGDKHLLDEYDDNDIFYSYSCDIDKFIEAYEYLSSNQVITDIYEDEYIKCHINLDENKYVLFRIGYNDNIKAYIDGEEVSIIAVDNALIEINIPAGEHLIEFRYEFPQIYMNILYFNILFIIVVLLYSTIVIIKEKKAH